MTSCSALIAGWQSSARSVHCARSYRVSASAVTRYCLTVSPSGVLSIRWLYQNAVPRFRSTFACWKGRVARPALSTMAFTMSFWGAKVSGTGPDPTADHVAGVIFSPGVVLARHLRYGLQPVRVNVRQAPDGSGAVAVSGGV